MAETGVILKDTGNLLAKVGLFYFIKTTKKSGKTKQCENKKSVNSLLRIL
jgi:hypothetical protein